MVRYKKILVGFDGSDSSKHALRQAMRLAGLERSRIKVVTVIPKHEGEMQLWVGNVKDAMRKSAELILAQAKEIAALEDEVINAFIEEGNPFEKIVDLADECECDLIVMGRRGRSQFEQALVGSVTARVIGNTRRDVLVVPQQAAIGWRRILLPMDGSRFSDLAAERAIDFARSYGGEVMIVSVVDVTDEFATQAPQMMEQMIAEARHLVEGVQSKIQGLGVKAEGIVREGDAHAVIATVARQQGADIIVMGSHGRTGLKRLLMGSVTERVIGTVSCPVLVAKN